MAALAKKITVAVISKMPAPYRVKVLEILSEEEDMDVHVFYLSKREPNRSWEVDGGTMSHSYVPGKVLKYKDRFVHVNPTIWKELKAKNPSVVITSGYNITDLVAILYCLRYRARHVSQTDGTLASEANLSVAHRVIRRVVARGTSAYIAPSEGSRDLFRTFGVGDEGIFMGPLAVQNELFLQSPSLQPYDLLFSSRFVSVKNPHFVIEAAARAAILLGRPISCLFLGDGPLLSNVKEVASEEPLVKATFAGFVQQADLPSWYSQAKIFLFPTSWDPWGVVLNEACAAGLPVVVTPFAGAAGELVLDGTNGFILDLEVEVWSRVIVRLLSDPEERTKLGANGRAQVQRYTFKIASEGYASAVRYAMGDR